MDAVTYPNAQVTSFINDNMIPLRVKYNAEPLASDFNVQWTPTLVTLDPDGKEHMRTVGYIRPEELVPSLLLGIAKWHFDSERFEDARRSMDKILAEYPESEWVPEAIYLRGVSRYKKTGDAKHLKEAYELLAAQHPTSVWTSRAYPYRLL